MREFGSEIMEILGASDLTHCPHSAAELAVTRGLAQQFEGGHPVIGFTSSTSVPTTRS